MNKNPFSGRGVYAPLFLYYECKVMYNNRNVMHLDCLKLSLIAIVLPNLLKHGFCRISTFLCFNAHKYRRKGEYL